MITQVKCIVVDAVLNSDIRIYEELNRCSKCQRNRGNTKAHTLAERSLNCRKSILSMWYDNNFPQTIRETAQTTPDGPLICGRCHSSCVHNQLNLNPQLSHSFNNLAFKNIAESDFAKSTRSLPRQRSKLLQDSTAFEDVILEWDKAKLIVDGGNLDHYYGRYPPIVPSFYQQSHQNNDHLQARELYRRTTYAETPDGDSYGNEFNCFLNKITCKWPRCTKVTTILEIHTHQDLCEFRTSACKWPGCEAEVLCKDLEQHESLMCTRRPYTCKWCFDSFTYEEGKWHQDNCCLERRSRCKWCNNLILILELSEHEDKICLLRHVECIWCKEPYPISEIGRHKEIQCQKRETQCRWCSKMILHVDAKKHQGTECQLRTVPCTWCLDYIPIAHIKVHQYETCLKRKVKCMWCANLFQLSDIEQHMEVLCPNRRISCEWCSFLVPVSEVTGHEEKCTDRKQSCKWCTDLVQLAEVKHHERWCDFRDSRTYGCAICSRFEAERPELVVHLQDNHICDIVYGELCEGSQIQGSKCEGWYMFSFGVMFLCRFWFRRDGSVVFNTWYVGRDEEAHRYRVLVELNKLQSSLIKETYCKPYNTTGGDIFMQPDEVLYFVDINVLGYTCRICKVVCYCDLCKTDYAK